MATEYFGSIWARGRRLDSQRAETREGAARILFTRNPRARIVSTSIATYDETIGQWRDYGRDIRHINRMDLPGVDGFRSDGGYLPDDVLA